MMQLEDFRPSQEELDLTEEIPEQVAIGYIRAKRKSEMRKRRPGSESLADRIFRNNPRGYPLG